eukprot:11238957-Ditylum_brightwellii.AAC.1
MQQEIMMSITTSVINSTKTVIDNNIQQTPEKVLGDIKQGECSPQKTATGLGHVNQRSATDTDKK